MTGDFREADFSYSETEAVAGFKVALENGLSFRGDPIAIIDQVLVEHPKFAMGWLFRASWLTQAMETRIYEEMVNSVAHAQNLESTLSDWERGYLQAMECWLKGDFFTAVQKWEQVLTAYPYDLFALALVHYTNVLLGDVVGQRDVVARVFNLWDESMPGFEFVLGFYAFGLEENRDFSHAEEVGRQALALRPDNPYAVHAVCHVMEMRGRQVGGIRFMMDHVERWGTSNFANHLWWHTALFHLDLEQIEQVLNIYDENISSEGKKSDKYEELDAAALLWRLNLLDVNVGNRWEHLADKWEPAANDTLYAFNDVHAMMTFVSDNRKSAQDDLLSANERYVEWASDANVAMSREMGLPFSLAILDFAHGNYRACTARLLPARYRTHRLGGSFAQRDVIGWTLLEAALRAKDFDLALALANERTALKPNSVQNWRAVARAHKGLGQTGYAARANARAESLLAA